MASFFCKPHFPTDTLPLFDKRMIFPGFFSHGSGSNKGKPLLGDIYGELVSSLNSFPGGSDGKESRCNAGDTGSIPVVGRSPGEGNDNPLQYSCLENFMNRGA